MRDTQTEIGLLLGRFAAVALVSVAVGCSGIAPLSPRDSPTAVMGSWVGAYRGMPGTRVEMRIDEVSGEVVRGALKGGALAGFESFVGTGDSKGIQFVLTGGVKHEFVFYRLTDRRLQSSGTISMIVNGFPVAFDVLLVKTQD